MYFSLYIKETPLCTKGNYYKTHNQSKYVVLELNPNWYIYNTTTAPKVQESLSKSGPGRLLGPEQLEICYEFVSSR